MYLNSILAPIRVCKTYKPKFGLGQGSGISLAAFQALYQADPFYYWFGLNNPLMYAAHKAAGGMTSVYRQIGIGCERLFRHMIRDALALADEDVIWSYEVMGANSKARTLSLDARIPVAAIANEEARARVQEWMRESAAALGVVRSVSNALTGSVFEVRQGYKSKDSKRQNADISNAATAYATGYLPCIAVLSGQIDTTVKRRYQIAKWSVLTGTVGANDPLASTYDFARVVIGYDLAAFFERNKQVLREEINLVLEALLTPTA